MAQYRPRRRITNFEEAKRIRDIMRRHRREQRPKMLGGSPSAGVARRAYVFTQSMRCNAKCTGMSLHAVSNIIVHFHGTPEIPRPGSDAMKRALEMSLRYIRHAEATTEGYEMVLFADDDGKITLRKSKDHPYGFNYQFVDETDACGHHESW